MKQKLNKTIQKIALILVCITTLNFIAPTQISNADIGGALFSPIKELFATIGDVVMDLLDLGLTGTWKSVIKTGILDADYAPGSDDDNNLWVGDDDAIDLPRFRMSPETIFSNKVELLNIDFINPINSDDYTVKNEDTTTALKDLRKVIASWYVAIRNLSLVAMLSILVYVGIKIIISSAASDKAKYKQMLVDWLVGICLLFMLHYIMAFTLFVTESITNLISSSATENVELNNNPKGKNGKTGPIKFNEDYTYNGKDYKKGDELTTVQNLTAYARFYVQIRDVKKSFTFLIIYLALVVYTVMFAIIYLKRVLTIAFLTMIAPFVAMTYPIDKMNDGKAQAFNMWFKEYLMNALIQPFHLILYTVLIGSAVDLASNNLLYALVAMGFLVPAEKLLKKMFGLDKGATPPGLGGAIAAGAGSQIAKSLMSKGKGTNVKPGSGGNGSAENTSSSATKNRNNYDFGGMNNTNLPQEDKSMSEFNQEANPNENNNTEISQGLQQAADGSLALGAAEIGKNESENHEIPQGLQQAENGDLALGIGEDEEYKGLRDAYKENKNTPQVQAESKKGTARKMAKLAARKALRKTGRKIGRTIKNPKTWKTVGKAIGTVAGGMTVGVAGAMVTGALTGDASKAAAAFGTGMALGNKLGGATAGVAIGAVGNIGKTVNDIKDLKAEATEGWDVAQKNKKDRLIQQQAKEFMKNTENREFFENKTGKYGKERDEMMEKASYYNQFEDFKDNDAKKKAVELEDYYVNERGYSQEDARIMVQAGASMANRKSEENLDKSETYTNEINNKGGRNYDQATKKQMEKDLMISAKYMKGMSNKPEVTRQPMRATGEVNKKGRTRKKK